MLPDPDCLPPYLSVSQISTYLGCPRKYRFRYLEKREPETRSVDLAFGSAAHSAIEWWFSERIVGRSPAEDAVRRIFRADWTSQRVDPLLDYDGERPQDLQTLGESLITLFLERFRGEPHPEQVEARFEVPLRDPATGERLPLPLVGYLDFLQDSLVGEIKTASKKTPANTWSLQLAAYSYAVRETTGQRPRLKVVVLIKTKTPGISVEEFALTSRQEAWFVEVAGEVLRGILQGTYHPIPSWQCPRCEYRRACRGG